MAGEYFVFSLHWRDVHQCDPLQVSRLAIFASNVKKKSVASLNIWGKCGVARNGKMTSTCTPNTSHSCWTSSHSSSEKAHTSSCPCHQKFLNSLPVFESEYQHIICQIPACCNITWHHVNGQGIRKVSNTIIANLQGSWIQWGSKIVVEFFALCKFL